jgi:flavin-dependent dehydrogenase
MVGERVIGVDTSDGRILGRFTVDATGRRRVLGERLGVGWVQHGPKRRVWYGYAAGVCPARAERPAMAADRDGWTWVARIREELFQWTRYNFDNARPPDGWRPPELGTLSSTGPTRGHDATWRIAAQPAGAGYFLAGDAAAVLDPASSHGVLKALMTGSLAGHLIGLVMRDEVTLECAAVQYSRWVREWFEHDVAKLGALYARLRRADRDAPCG